jgi:hypothetical protein
MQSPSYELRRIAKHLELEIDSRELQNYKTEFLSKELRHTFYNLNDLLLDDACPPLVQEIYSDLLDVASDDYVFGGFDSKVVRWSDEFERLKSPLKLIDKFLAQKVVATQTIDEREASLTRLEQTIAERDASLTRLKQTLTDVYNSNSWKMMKPFRIIKKIINELLAK